MDVERREKKTTQQAEKKGLAPTEEKLDCVVETDDCICAVCCAHIADCSGWLSLPFGFVVFSLVHSWYCDGSYGGWWAVVRAITVGLLDFEPILVPLWDAIRKRLFIKSTQKSTTWIRKQTTVSRPILHRVSLSCWVCQKRQKRGNHHLSNDEWNSWEKSIAQTTSLRGLKEFYLVFFSPAVQLSNNIQLTVL